jgi:hypothetical protein
MGLDTIILRLSYCTVESYIHLTVRKER